MTAIEQTKRYFLAISIDCDTTQFQSIQSPKFRFVNQHHITLQYFGELSTIELQTIKKRLDEFKAKSFHVEFDSTLETFPNWQNPNVLYVPILSRKVTELAKSLHAIFRDMFVKPEFVPHMTIARVREKLSQKEIDLLQSFSCRIEKIPVTKLFLYASILTPSGAVYTVEKSLPLTKI
jgi:2'-5' RNA ligase